MQALFKSAQHLYENRKGFSAGSRSGPLILDPGDPKTGGSRSPTLHLTVSFFLCGNLLDMMIWFFSKIHKKLKKEPIVFGFLVVVALPLGLALLIAEHNPPCTHQPVNERELA